MPNPKTTETDFWRMIWQTKAQLIVVLEATRNLWPKSGEEKALNNSQLQVSCEWSTSVGEEFDASELIVKRLELDLHLSSAPHHCYLIQYKRWKEDEFVPEGLARFGTKIRMLYERVNRSSSSPVKSAPLMVVCRNVSSVTGSGECNRRGAEFREVVGRERSSLWISASIGCWPGRASRSSRPSDCSAHNATDVSTCLRTICSSQRLSSISSSTTTSTETPT